MPSLCCEASARCLRSSGSMATMQLLEQARLALPTTTTTRTKTHLVSPCSRPRVVGSRNTLTNLPRSRVLPSIGSSLKLVSSSPQNAARSRRGGVVCEAQESAVTTGVTGVVDEATWKSLVADADVPVLVDFWAPWCGPCRMIAPIIDEIAKKYAGKVRCLKLNTDESPNIATEYGIRSIPTVMVFLKGEKSDTVIGAVPMQTLTSTLEKYVAW